MSWKVFSFEVSEMKELTKSIKDELESSFNDDYYESNESDDESTTEVIE